jgi:signal transduction histidine kinase
MDATRPASITCRLVAFPSAVLSPLQHTTARIAVWLRVGLCVLGIPMALLAGPPSAWLLPVAGGYAVFVAGYSFVALRWGLLTPLVAADVVVAVVICLLNASLVPIGVIEDGSGWVAVLGSFSVVSLPFAWRASAAIPAGLLIVAAFRISFFFGDQPKGGWVHAAVMVVQLFSSAAVMAVVRRASAQADTALEAAQQSRRAAQIAHARRADEVAQLRLLHDTALTTLTFVGTGTIERSGTLVDRASADLTAIERLAAQDAAAPHRLVRLDELLTRAARHTGALRVDLTTVPCLVPTLVADAFAGGASEALLNTARHAGVPTASLQLATAPGRVRVEVADAGRGFDPASAVAHRYGVRHSILGRMAAVGGYARVESAPGAGTRWILEWSTPDGAA